MELESKYEALRKSVRELNRVLVAYSGGLDSTLLLKTCLDVLGKSNVVAFIGDAPTFPAEEIRDAKRIASSMGVTCVVENTDILGDEQFLENTKQRCYHCKKRLLHMASEAAKGRGIVCILEGTNFDDTRDFRPGSIAVREMGVLSPLLTAKLTKDDIRKLSKKLSLPTYGKPPYACLATRIPYGTRIEAALLKQIELSEKIFKGMGISQVRVRYHGNTARIEVATDNLETVLRQQKKIVKRLKEYGFTFVTLDLEGYRTGSMNVE